MPFELIEIPHWFLINMFLRVGFSRCLQALVHWCGFHAARGEWCTLLCCLAAQTVAVRYLLSCCWLLLSSAPCVHNSTSSCMHVMNHNWSATKQRLHPQSVAKISRHSVLSGDRIWQCGTLSGSCHKDTDQCLSRHFLLQAPQCPKSTELLWHRDHGLHTKHVASQQTRPQSCKLIYNIMLNLKNTHLSIRTVSSFSTHGLQQICYCCSMSGHGQYSAKYSKNILISKVVENSCGNRNE